MMNVVAGPGAFVGGGYGNAASGPFSTLGGGQSNIVEGDFATLCGGYGNAAPISHATVGGGGLNVASGPFSTVPGGFGNIASGAYSFAAGCQAAINDAHGGTFLFSDQSGTPFNSAAANEFAVRASGGVRFLTDSGATVGVSLGASGTSWAVQSLRSLKENYEDIDAEEVLDTLAALPIQKWNYIANDDATKHIGPYAEDFYEAFGLNGEFNGRITTQDIDGVALAAIQGVNERVQGLNAKLVERDSQIDALKAENRVMSERLAAIERRLTLSAP